jgi:hypothetical protein
MEAKKSSWWQKIRKPLAVIAAIALFAGVLVRLILEGYRLTWTGFFNKTLWDWLQLLAALAIPVVVGFGAVWFTTRQGKVTDAENTDNQRETALQAYIDSISELLLHEKLRDSAEDGEVRKIARVRTLTVLPRLDERRKRSVLKFLQESGLIDKGTSIIALAEADLNEALLDTVNLRGASLQRVDLREADLSKAYLSGANLSGALQLHF